MSNYLEQQRGRASSAAATVQPLAAAVGAAVNDTARHTPTQCPVVAWQPSSHSSGNNSLRCCRIQPTPHRPDAAASPCRRCRCIDPSSARRRAALPACIAFLQWSGCFYPAARLGSWPTSASSWQTWSQAHRHVCGLSLCCNRQCAGASGFQKTVEFLPGEPACPFCEP